MSETQLATRQEKTPVIADKRGVQLSTMEEMWRFCTAVVNSGQIKDINTPEVALIRLQAGMELGLSPIWSLSNIMVQGGRPSVFGDALLGIVLAQPTCEDVIEELDGTGDAMVATCTVKRRGRTPTVRRFSVADAKKAGLWGKTGPWTQYSQRMLAMRARSWACRDAFADALRGLGVVEEMRDVEPRQVAARVVSAEMVLPDESPSVEAEFSLEAAE